MFPGPRAVSFFLSPIGLKTLPAWPAHEIAQINPL